MIGGQNSIDKEVERVLDCVDKSFRISLKILGRLKERYPEFRSHRTSAVHRSPDQKCLMFEIYNPGVQEGSKEPLYVHVKPGSPTEQINQAVLELIAYTIGKRGVSDRYDITIGVDS